MERTIKNLVIERYVTPNFKSLLEITPSNKNYEVLIKINTILDNNNKTFSWMLERLNVSKYVRKSYLSGQEHLSLKTIELISIILKDYINNPKELMNPSFPILKYGSGFKLNVKEIRNKYYITNSQIIIGTGIDKGCLHCIISGKTTQLRVETLSALFHFFKDKGVPLKSLLDLFYFPDWNELPLHFISEQPKVNGSVFKFNSTLHQSTSIK